MTKNDIADAITQAVTEQWQGGRVQELAAKLFAATSGGQIMPKSEVSAAIEGDNKHLDAEIAAFDAEVSEETGEEPLGASPKKRGRPKKSSN